MQCGRRTYSGKACLRRGEKATTTTLLLAPPAMQRTCTGTNENDDGGMRARVRHLYRRGDGDGGSNQLH